MWQRVGLAPKGQVWEALLRYVGMLVFLIRAERIECLHAEDPDDPAEDVRLLVIQLNDLSGAILDVLDCLPDVDWLQTPRQRGRG